MGLAGGNGERMDGLFGEDGDVGRGGGGGHGFEPPLFERLGGELADFGIAALQRELRVPQLEGGADADEQGEILELAAAAQLGGQQDAAAGVVGDLLGAAEAAALARIMGDRVALLLGQPPPLVVEIEEAQIIGVEAGQAGLDRMAGEDDGAGVRAPLDLLADAGGHGEAALGVDRHERAAAEK